VKIIIKSTKYLTAKIKENNSFA